MSLIGTPSDVGRMHRGIAGARRRRRRDEEDRERENREQGFFQSESVRRKIIRERLTREAAARTPAARAELDRRTQERAEFVGPPEPSGRVRTTPAQRRAERQARRAAKDREMAQNLQDRDIKREDAQSRKIERRNRIRSKLGLPPLPGGGISSGAPQRLRGAAAPIQIEDTETFDRRTVRPGEFVRTPDGQVSQFIVNRAGVETFVPFTTGPTGALIPDLVDQMDFPLWEQTLPFNERRDLGSLAIDSQTDFGTRIRGIHRERNAIIDAIDLDGTMTEAQARGPREDLDRREAQILFEFVRSGAAKRAQHYPPDQGIGQSWVEHGILMTRNEKGEKKKIDRVDGGEENLKLAEQAVKNLTKPSHEFGGLPRTPSDEELEVEFARLQDEKERTRRLAQSMLGEETPSDTTQGGPAITVEQEQERKQDLQRLQAPEQGAELTIAPAQAITSHVERFHPEADTPDKQRFLARRIARELGWNVAEEQRVIRGRQGA